MDGEKKIVETGTLINLLYKTDGFSRLALVTGSEEDFENYIIRNDSLYEKIEEIKSLTSDDFQRKQLDSIRVLLEEKNTNIEQLRILRLTNQKETSLDDIMKEVRKLEASVGLASVESMVREPWKLTARERRIWQSYADYLNSSAERNQSMVKSKVVDSMLIASRYIVAEAKKENSRIRESLIQKENELIRNDLNISERLRKIISSFDAELAKNADDYALARAEALHKTGQVLKFAAVLGVTVVLLFSYFVLSDFFKAERYKRFLEASKKYSETLLKSREQLISTVSHDLNTPLNTISGYSELLQNTSLTPTQEKYLSHIVTGSEFINRLVNDLLDYSKLEAGKLTPEQKHFSLEHLIVDTASAVEQAYRKPMVLLEVAISPELKNRFFSSDPLRIRQILNNLLSNAFKFTEKGKVSISAEPVRGRSGQKMVKIMVKDTGIGIAKEKQKAIFEEFTQADASIAGRFGGSGLGLAISKKLTTLLQGTLHVDSVPGEGSCFTLLLPLSPIEKDPLPKNNTPGTATPTAIIIDDDSSLSMLLCELLKNLSVACLSFKSYSDFKNADVISNLKYDLIITDIQMPEIDGFQLLDRLKNGDIKSFSNQPVIAMTGDRNLDRKDFMKKGFIEVLRKPFSSQDLVMLLQNFVEVKKDREDVAPVSSIKTDDFDLKMLYSFLETKDEVNKILHQLKQQTDKDLRDMHEAVAVGNFETIRHISHRMLTMYKQICAVKVIPILEELENLEETIPVKEVQIILDLLKKRIIDLEKDLIVAVGVAPSV